MIAPTTDIILYKSDLELDNTNQLKFNTWNDQWAYFSNLPHIYLDNATYKRKEGVIRFPTGDVSFDELIRYNYVSYKNEAYANKTFFAYVKNMRYVNDGMTEIEIETDPFQTWQFDLIYRKCFVEREHVRDDSRGANTIPEGLELGEITMAAQPTVVFNDPADFYICFAVSEDPYESLTPFSGMKRQYNGIFGGLFYIFCKTVDDANNLVSIYDSTGKADAINYIFMIPNQFDILSSYADWKYPLAGTATYTSRIYFMDDTQTASVLGGITCELPTTLGNGYSPRNNKLLTYPFSYMTLSNNSGTETVFRYEDFTYDSINPVPVFAILGSLTPGCSIKACPIVYKNSTGINYNYGINFGKLPICSWNSDVYTNWLTQNGVNNAADFLLGAATTVGSIAQGSGAGVVGGVKMAYNAVHEEVQTQIIPNQARGNTNAGDINFSYDHDGGFTVHYLSVRNEIARVIDNYFDMYGYKVNRLKVPEIHSRVNWNYVKTIDCNFSGDIPGDDLVKLRQMFNDGLTIWHNPRTFLDYSQSNYII